MNNALAERYTIVCTYCRGRNLRHIRWLMAGRLQATTQPRDAQLALAYCDDCKDETTIDRIPNDG